MAIQSVINDINLSGVTNYYLNHPSNPGMADGYWFYYSSSVANNVLGTRVKPYRWGQALNTNETGDFFTIEGTIQLVSESLNRTRVFHGSGIVRGGAGTNVQTGNFEDDSFFFYHLGELRANDQVGYWDYGYLPSGGEEWVYFQYHAHAPSVYEDYYGGRLVNNGYSWINSQDKRYIQMHNVSAKSANTFYSNILARVHRPSIGGAHNSHYDVELGSVITKNYIIGGAIPGTANRFHCFYLAANGSQWDVFSRTYVMELDVFTAEVNHGTYDLADPTYTPNTIPNGIQDKLPFRASSGFVFENNVYVPVIYNGAGGTFDLKVWKFESTNTIPTNAITVQTILTGYTQRPDCHLTSDGTKLTAIVSDVNNGGVEFFTLDGSTWTNVGNVVTNGNQDIIRIHGFDYNSTDSRFYMLLSGDVTGSVGSYSGSGVYSFTEGLTSAGYQHLSYITSSYGFQVKGPNESGFISYQNLVGSLVFSTGIEPSGIQETERILTYGESTPRFYEKMESVLGGSHHFNDGIQLRDNRLMFIGTIEGNEGNRGNKDLLLTLYDDNMLDPEFFATGGNKDDNFSALVNDPDNNRVWAVGFTKSYLAPKKEIFIHGFGRALTDGPSTLEWKDMVIDNEGNQYFTGNHIENTRAIVAKYDPNFDLLWQYDLYSSDDDESYGITLDTDKNVYVIGKTNYVNGTTTDAFVSKLSTSGSLLWSKVYGTSGDEYGSSITCVLRGGSEFIVTSIVSGSDSIINVLNTSGSIIEQNIITGFTVNRVRKSETETNGYFLMVGKDDGTPSKTKIAKGQVLSSGDMVQWTTTYTSGSLASEGFDIKNTESSTGAGGLGSLTGPTYQVVGSEGTNGYLLKFIVDEDGGSYQASKVWSTNISGSILTSLTSEPYTTTPSSSIYTYVVGHSGVSPEGEGMLEGIISKFDYDGNRLWTNTLGHMGDEKLFAIDNDVTGRNLIYAGWSESHTNGRRTFSFRSDKSGFGTGNYHLNESPALAMWYQSSSLDTSVNNGSFGTLTISSNIGASLTGITGSLAITNQSYPQEYYEGGNVFDMFICKIDLDSIAIHKNSKEHQEVDLECTTRVEYVDEIFTFYQWGAAGDGLADDGNFFGDAILLMSGSGKVFVAGETSGDFQKFNLGATGVYDYILTVFDPVTHEYEFYQNGTELDEEIFGAAELNDGSGSIAFVGRTQGTLGGPIIGGYDIFMGIYNPITDVIDYYQTGSGQIDRAVNVHDVGNNELAIIYETADIITTGSVSSGGVDVGIMFFNYETRQWATSSYQVGTSEDDILTQIGRPSLFLPDSNRIAIVGKTLGTFAQDGFSYGSADIFLALFDITSKTYSRYQVGSEGNETPTTVFPIGGERLVIGGYTDASFSEPDNSIFVKFDGSIGVKGKSS